MKQVFKATKMMQSEFSNKIGPAGTRKLRKLQQSMELTDPAAKNGLLRMPSSVKPGFDYTGATDNMLLSDSSEEEE